MLKNEYYQTRKHCRYFSLYWATCQLSPAVNAQDNSDGIVKPSREDSVCIVASKKGVHKNAVKRNFAKRRLRAALRNFLKTDSLPAVSLKIVAKRELLVCSFSDLNIMLQQNLKALS